MVFWCSKNPFGFIQLTVKEQIKQKPSTLALVFHCPPQTLVQNPASESRQRHFEHLSLTHQDVLEQFALPWPFVFLPPCPAAGMRMKSWRWWDLYRKNIPANIPDMFGKGEVSSHGNQIRSSTSKHNEVMSPISLQTKKNEQKSFTKLMLESKRGPARSKEKKKRF